jgi:prepilin-type N-terminal cleavage/methylation domain-containing protein
MWHSSLRTERGFTLLEAMVTLTIMGIVGGMAAASLSDTRRTLQGDGAMRVVMIELNTARDMAMAQRRNMEVQFVGGTWVRTVRHEAPGIVTTIVRNVALESNATFSQVSGIPDTPDAFGASAPVAFGAAQVIQFGTDGMLIDGSGNPVNGTIFLAIANLPLTARAVTVLGATGRVRGYKWVHGVWKRV